MKGGNDYNRFGKRKVKEKCMEVCVRERTGELRCVKRIGCEKGDDVQVKEGTIYNRFGKK